jgi:putative peptide zinc metalloprotease protein
MAGDLFSPYWYRVKALRPCLRSHARIHRHHYRGQRWYVLQDTSSGRHHRFSPAAYYLIALMDGNRTVREIWDAAMTQLGDDAPTQGETILLLAQLHAADVLRCDVPPDALEVFQRFTHHKRAGRLRRFLNPLFARFPLFDPDAFLERALPLVRPVFSVPGLVAWIAVVGLALALAGANWRALTHTELSSVLDPRHLLLLALTYVVVKAVHELGHAFATKVWGGEVHEMGIMLLVLMPVPYVDASSASSFGDKRKRMLVGAAGVMVELFLASLGLFVWLNTAPGALRTVAYDVMVIGGVSTLFFNGNPLLRFDGYYVLADALEIPNLSTRSSQYLAYLFQHYVLGLVERRSRATAPGERRWLIVYGLGSYLYRLFILLAIALFVAGKFFFVGVLLAIWSITLQVLLPPLRGLHRLRSDPRFWRAPARVAAAGALLAAGFAMLLFVVPIPSWTVTEGVVWPPDRSQVRTGADGFVRRILATPNDRVEAGQPLIETVDPLLRARVKVLEARRRELRARYQRMRQEDVVEAKILVDELETVDAEISRARERAAEAIVRSPDSGRFVLPRSRDLPGSFVKRGQVLGYVSNFSTPTVRTLVSQADVALVRERTREVRVRLAGRVAETFSASIQREVPAASDRLPSMALGAAGGGSVAVDRRDEQGLTAVEKLFQLDLLLAADAPVRRIGGRVYVRFDHGTEPLFWRIYRATRRLFLGRLGV